MKFGRILIFILAFLLIENCFNLDRKTKKLKRKSVKIKKRRQNEPVLNCGNMFIATICDLLNKEVLKEYAKAVASTFKNMNVLQVDLPNLDFDNIASSEKTPKLLSLAIKGIGLNMKFTNNKVMVAFNPTTVNVRIQTKVKENDIDLFILKKDADPVFILSTKIPMNNIYEFIEKFSGIKIGESNPLRWIDSSSISLLFSSGAYSFSDYPKEMAPTYFESKGLLGTGKNTQLIIEAMIKIAATKEKNKINDFIRFLIPDKLILGLKVDSQAIDANIGLTNVKLSEKFTLAYGGVFFKITYASPQSPEIGFKGSLKFPVSTMKEKEGDEPEEEKESEKNFLVLGGSIGFTPLDLKFTFSLDSIWNPFGLKRFHAGNLYFETAVNYETIVPTALKLAGEFAIGLECYEIKENKAVFKGSGRCIQAKAAVFIDVIKIGENGFMLEVAKLDFQTFANALFAKTATEVYPVNGFLQNLISFPDGLKVSFAPKSFTVGSISIDGGIQVKATIESFHKKAKFEVKIGFTLIPNMKIRIEIEEEIKVADLVVISKTGEAPKNEVAPIIPEDDDKKKEKKKGPIFDLNIASGALSGEVDVYVNVLGIAAGVKIKIATNNFEFSVSGSLFGIITAKLSVKSSYDKESGKLLAMIEAELEITDIAAKMGKFLSSLSEKMKQKENYLESKKLKYKNKAKMLKATHASNFRKFKNAMKKAYNKVKKMTFKGFRKFLDAMNKVVKNIGDFFTLKRIYFKIALDKTRLEKLQVEPEEESDEKSEKPKKDEKKDDKKQVIQKFSFNFKVVVECKILGKDRKFLIDWLFEKSVDFESSFKNLGRKLLSLIKKKDKKTGEATDAIDEVEGPDDVVLADEQDDLTAVKDYEENFNEGGEEIIEDEEDEEDDKTKPKKFK